MAGKSKQTPVVFVKRLILAIERRRIALAACCPSLVGDDDDEAEKLRNVSTAQGNVDTAIKELRVATDGRLAKYSDAEVAMIAHLWAGIWSSDGNLSVDSGDIDKLVGRNNAEQMDSLIRTLLDGTSPLFDFITLAWSNRGRNDYSINITSQNRLHKLILGDIQIA